MGKTYQALRIPTYLPQSQSYATLKPTTLPSALQNPSAIPRTHVLVRVTHTSINHVDLLYARGLHQNNHSGLVKPPFTLGLEFAGVVSYVPPNQNTPDVKDGENGRYGKYGKDGKDRKGGRWKVGDRVWGGCLGSHAGEVLVPATALRKVPDDVSLEDAAGIGAGSAVVSYGALVRCAGIQRGENVLVHAAAGGLGVSAVQIAFSRGCRVIGTVGSERKKEVLLKELGGCLVGVVNYSVEGWEKEVVQMAEGEGVDVVYDTVGLVKESIRCIKFKGRIVVAGYAGRGGKIEELPMNRVLLKNAQLLGYRFGERGRRDPKETEACWEGVEGLMREGKLKAVRYGVFKGLDRVGGLMEDLKERKVYGKAVVELCSEKEAMKLRGRL